MINKLKYNNDPFKPSEEMLAREREDIEEMLTTGEISQPRYSPFIKLTRTKIPEPPKPSQSAQDPKYFVPEVPEGYVPLTLHSYAVPLIRNASYIRSLNENYNLKSSEENNS